MLRSFLSKEVSKKQATWILAFILFLYFTLTVYGITWGLPDRWNVDEQVAKTLRLIHSKSPLTLVDETHPQFYNFIVGCNKLLICQT